MKHLKYINVKYICMDYQQISDYYLWAEDRIQGKIGELTEEEFSLIFSELGWSMRDFVEHLFVLYEWSFTPHIIGSFQRIIEKAKKMDRETLMQNWKMAREKFTKELIECNKNKIQMTISKEKTILLKREEFFFLITDHQTYHRGQMTTILKLLGKEGVKTDYYYFVVLEKLSHSFDQKKKFQEQEGI